MVYHILLYSFLALSHINHGAPHKFYVSRCMVEYNAEERALQMSMHIFIDDLETALAERGADSLFICTRMEHPDAETYMARYLADQFRIRIDGQPVTYKFLGKEISEDLQAVWCYLEITDLDPFEQLEVTNELLIEVYDDQKNIMHVIGPNRREGTLLFRKGSTSETVTFKRS